LSKRLLVLGSIAVNRGVLRFSRFRVYAPSDRGKRISQIVNTFAISRYYVKIDTPNVDGSSNSGKDRERTNGGETPASVFTKWAYDVWGLCYASGQLYTVHVASFLKRLRARLWFMTCFLKGGFRQAALVLAVFSLPTIGTSTISAEEPRVFGVEGDVAGVHDPSISKEGDTWYLFATTPPKAKTSEQFPIRCSKDLLHWKVCGFVFSEIPAWIKKESPKTTELWAPDISYFDGKFHLYYAYSAFGVNTSGIALLTNKTLDSTSPDFRWVDEGLVLKSRAEDDFNAIDPNLILDEKGLAWLSFGSFWSGIKMRKLDRKTGKLSTEDTKLCSLASRHKPEQFEPAKPGLPPDYQAIEAPFIVRHGEYYYLFVSYDLCCRGLKSTYRTMVGRSKNVTGAYEDADGNKMSDGAAMPLLQANQKWLGPGGESILLAKGQDIIVYHAYNGKTGMPALQISTLTWTNGWPHAALDGDAASATK
jgi:arabinan endo-1,5-alpha-L-arabinosidase